ncbi:MAG: hypothetical protein ABL895_17295 [Cyclobacteriaceae bacterium]
MTATESHTHYLAALAAHIQSQAKSVLNEVYVEKVVTEKCPVENWDELQVTEILNGYLVGTKILPGRKRNRDFFRPIELMEDLINTVDSLS